MIPALTVCHYGKQLLSIPSPNDNFTNATVLTGNDIVFTGSLLGATSELGEPAGEPVTFIDFSARSVWWSWTAPTSGPVTLVSTSYGQDTATQGESVCLAVYSATNGLAAATPPALACMRLDSMLKNLALSFS